MIDPKDIISEYSPEEICEGAEAYYAANSDPRLHIQKPFRSFTEAAESLEKLGILLSEMKLGRGMRVLDFGAGTCWISAYLQQMGCHVTSCDPSSTALEIGRKLVEANPFIEHDTAQYLRFNGRTIEAPDGTFDRILCYDTLHHVPNWRDIITEMVRTLKPGGIVGFKEPGYKHSSSTSAQAEMRNDIVLENDIHLDEIVDFASLEGLDFLGWKAVFPRCFDLQEYKVATKRSIFNFGRYFLKKKLFRSFKQCLGDNSIFYFSKGPAIIDSRAGEFLVATIEPVSDRFFLEAEKNSCLEALVTNSGKAVWLNETEDLFGTVMLGIHLYDVSGKKLNFDWARSRLLKSILPGESVTLKVDCPPLPKGNYFVEFDLVSEQVCWFEYARSSNSTPVRVSLVVA